jgi:hypothetical protein
MEPWCGITMIPADEYDNLDSAGLAALIADKKVSVLVWGKEIYSWVFQ